MLPKFSDCLTSYCFQSKFVVCSSSVDSVAAVDVGNESGIVPYFSKESPSSAEGAAIAEDHSEALVKKAEREEKKPSDETSAQPMATAATESSSEPQARVCVFDDSSYFYILLSLSLEMSIFLCLILFFPTVSSSCFIWHFTLF